MLLTPHLLFRNKEGQSQNLRRAGLWGPKIYVVPRKDTSFRRLSLSGTGRNALKAAKVRAARDAMTGQDKIFLGRKHADNSVAVWSYAGGDYGALRTLPETVARMPGSDGTRLVKMLDGVEGQIWSDHALIASRWWPRSPSAAQWQTFLKGAQWTDEEARLTVPAIQEVPFRSDLPVLDLDADRWAQIVSPLRAITACAVLVCGLAFYSAAQYLHYSLALSQTQNQIGQVSETTTQLLSQRRRALGNLRYANQLDGTGDKAILLKALSGVVGVVSGDDIKFQQIRISEGRLEVTIRGDASLTGPELVARLERIDVLDNVTVNLNTRNQLVVAANLLGSLQETGF